MITILKRFDSLAVTTVVVVIGACFGLAARSSIESLPTHSRVADDYALDDSPEMAAAFSGNEIIVVADIGDTLPARWDVDRSSDHDFAFIFTPIRVRVLEVLRGAPRPVDGTMIVRRLGGRVGDEQLIVADSVAPIGSTAGRRFILFLGPQRDIGGLDAATPNMAHVVDADEVATSSDGQHSLDLEAFRDLIRSSVSSE